MDNLDPKYNSKKVEENKYKSWIKDKIFEYKNTNKEAYSIIIPPPNVTGKLHLGHAWDGAIQDALIRFNKLQGKDVVWIPGMDHAGIATQIKVEQRLREQNISRLDLGREKFIEKIWEWKNEYSETIKKQWAKLGLALDYSREKFTFSPETNKKVKYVFVKMFEKKLIYKDKKIVNWDPKQKTALSNMEVIHKEITGNMYHFKYFLEGSNTIFLDVATTRPETMFGDVCLVVNPNDSRYKKYIGKKFVNPANNEVIPLIADDYVDVEFGTGVMKCTPAHDINDFEIKKRHNLNAPICMNIDGTMNSLALEFDGLDRFDARKKLVSKLEKNKTFIKKEEILHQVAHSERSDAIVEQYLSDQWFVNMKPLAKEVLSLQKSKNKISIFPNRFDATLENWMNDIHDWTISRQLWWGHRIPAWYNNKTGEMIVSEDEPKDIENWTQDESVLDTWFSSALWPLITTDWEPGKKLKDQNKFLQDAFPIDVLVTGYDIVFFWVARMIFQSLELIDEKPFKKLLFHGLIRDESGRKMSKSLGNGIDPMDVIDEYGADSLRIFLLTNSSPGLDLRYSTEKIKATWNFLNKVWNASRYIFMNIDAKNINIEQNFMDKFSDNFNNIFNKWILQKLSQCSIEVKKQIEKFEFTIAGKILSDFIWNDFCSWYIELSKPLLNNDDESLKKSTEETLVYVLKNVLIMLHPFAPFITEEIYSKINPNNYIFNEKWSDKEINFSDTSFVDVLINYTEVIRKFRYENEIKISSPLNFNLNKPTKDILDILNKNIDSFNKLLKKMCNSSVSLEQLKSDEVTSINISDYFIDILNDDFIDKAKVIESLKNQLDSLKKEIDRSEKILSNENFLSKANAIKINDEKNKYEDCKKKFNLIKEKLDNTSI